MTKFSDNSSIVGILQITLFDENGTIKDERSLSNLITTAGKTMIASRIVSDSTIAKVSHMAVGAGTTAANVSDTSLQTELGRSALTSQTSSGAVATCSAVFGPGVATGTITEAGILNAPSGGVLLNRSVFAAVNKAAADTLTISWTITAA